MREIPLTRGMVAMVDDEDYCELAKHKWTYSGTYAVRRGHTGHRQYPTLLMHRVITGAARGREVDHINGNPLDNRRQNLRLCSRAENTRNKGAIMRPGRTSLYKGVCWLKDEGRWLAYIVADGKQTRLGRHKTEDEAARAHNRAAISLHGEFAHLNAVPD